MIVARLLSVVLAILAIPTITAAHSPINPVLMSTPPASGMNPSYQIRYPRWTATTPAAKLNTSTRASPACSSMPDSVAWSG